MSNFRDIAPRPLDLAPAPVESTGARARPSKVAVACNACRTKRTKCDGARPCCGTCIDRDSTCKYSPPPAPVLAQSQKKKIEQLQKDKASLYEVLWFLRTKSPDKATALLQHIRSAQGEDVGAILKNFDANHVASFEHADEPNQFTDDSPSTESSVPTQITLPEVLEHPRLSASPKGQARGPGIALHLLSQAQQNATVEFLDPPINMFFNCVGALFYVMNRNDVRARYKAITASGNSHLPLGAFFSNESTSQLKTCAAELAGMAAIGVVHFQLADPEKAPPAELADYFYDVAKLGLDSAILYDPLRSMKLCALLGMYNIVVKATVALAYIELGLSLARNNKLSLTVYPPGWSVSDYDDIRRTHRTLVHLHCWLSASLDYTSHSLGPSHQLASVDNLNAPPEDMIRQECVKVTIIKAALLQHLPAQAPVPETTVFEFRAQLSRFHAQLPHWMSIGSLLGGNGGVHVMPELRPLIFYVHLFYLSAMMLLSRRLIIAYVSLDAIGKVHLPQEACLAIQEGYEAAQRNARVINLMLHEGNVVQFCWLCIYTAYTAGVMVAYKAAQKALYGRPFADELELLNKCISVLDFCAHKDAAACKFRDILAFHLKTLQDHHVATDGLYDSATPEDVPMADYLFTFHNGTSELHIAARDLLRVIHHPFSGLENVANQKTLSNMAETTLGAHLEWAYELNGVDCAYQQESSEHPGPTNVIPEPINMDGATSGQDASTQDMSMQNMSAQPQGIPWSTWTPPSWQAMFPEIHQ
ncbi:hypothetical protein EJ02DRAFT_92320 [Clathrospora elynae]|uniref:Zn(2)-C6 fungal-type domain-containing protein n=1 Tax=Clathrospora elynae TaxID=706981 RepID=A0A6A5T3J0_9PLEO|nr:hypothetical protein EJ02DRAFT_92320 [Clathrospora elynae]